jgi:hypothetical protein
MIACDHRRMIAQPSMDLILRRLVEICEHEKAIEQARERRSDGAFRRPQQQLLPEEIDLSHCYAGAPFPAQILSCPMCLAVYEKRKVRRPEKEKSSFACSCGHILARWKGFVVPFFVLVKRSTIRPQQ